MKPKAQLSIKQTDNILEIEGNIEWKYMHDADSGDWIAVCDLLSLTVTAESSKELRFEIIDAMELLFKSLAEEGDLDEFLKDRGWAQAKPALRLLPQDTPIDFDIPFQLNRATRLEDLHLAACH